MVRTLAHVRRLSTAYMDTRQVKGKNTRSRAPAQHCARASQMVRTPAHLHPLSAAHKSNRSRAPAQHCRHASQMVRTPAHVHPLSAAHLPGKGYDLSSNDWLQRSLLGCSWLAVCRLFWPVVVFGCCWLSLIVVGCCLLLVVALCCCWFSFVVVGGEVFGVVGVVGVVGSCCCRRRRCRPC